MAVVLVVEDLREAREGLRILLRRRGYEAVGASGGREALELLAAGAIDLILLDLSMPDLDGFEVLRRLPPVGELGRPPVVVFSALDDPESVRRARELGANEYLVKGQVTWRQVVERVGECLRARGTPPPVVSVADVPPGSQTNPDAASAGTESGSRREEPPDSPSSSKDP